MSRAAAKRATGADPIRIDGGDAYIALKVVSKLGTDKVEIWSWA